MKFGIFGDIHGRIEYTTILTIELFKKIVESIDVDAILQVGDMCYYPWSYSKPIYWIYGNNDMVEIIEDIETGRKDIENLRNIKTGEVLSFQKGDQSIRVSGLNGGYDGIYYSWERSELDTRNLRNYFIKRDVEACSVLKNIDIFLTHQCPSGMDFGRGLDKDLGAAPIRELVDRINPRFVFCGHLHRFKEVDYNGTRIYTLSQVKEEYYVLDTETEELERIKTDPQLVRG
ncbi:MAG: metallophosphoesterase [Pseudomonadota bacterium]